MGIGVLCFSFAGAEALKPLIEIYKKTIEDADPVGGYVNNNVMVTTAMMCMEDGDRAREVFRNTQSDYHTSLVAKYLDSFPQTAGIDKMPDAAAADPARAGEPARSRCGAIAVGTPEEAINTMRVYEDDRRRPGVVRCAVRRHAVRRRRRVGGDVRQVRASPSSTRTRSARRRVSARRRWARAH